MGEYRSNSYSNGRMQMQSYHGPTSYGDFRSYSASYASSSSSYAAAAAAAPAPPPPALPPPRGMKDWKLKKSNKSRGGSGGGSTSKSWSFSDPEFQRKRRVASYKVYSVEGKVKGSIRKSFRWLKNKYTQVVYGW